MEAVIAQNDDRGIVARELQQAAEHHVVKAVAPGHHVLVQVKVRLAHVVHSRRVILHEGVGEAIDGVIVHGHEVPFLGVHQPGGGGVRRRRRGQKSA